MDMIQPLFTNSKWNMCDIFALKFHISYELKTDAEKEY
jgi:hypothetical protein